MPKENIWKKEEDSYIEENYTGTASLAHISEKLGRSIASVKRRVLILISEGPEFQESRLRRMSELHIRDLKASGGRWT